MLTGLETVAEMINRYFAIERTYWNTGTETRFALKNRVQRDSSLAEPFDGAISNLYSKILEYQARCVCNISQLKHSRVVKGMFKIGNQDSLLEEVKRCDVECGKYFQIFDQELWQREFFERDLRHFEIFCSMNKGFARLQYAAEENLLKQKSLERDN